METENIGSRNLKRKADSPVISSPGPKRIKALDQDVVNKIAAGEIIVAPMHALKELIENSVDAGSTSLEIAVKDGGLKLLQITDNGHGINKDDLAILCERFTTSKLKTFEDLTSIGTYGFRGEALASISHIAHLTITTRTSDSSCAWRAHYMDGKLAPAKPGQSADPKPTAGRGGTQITVEDLFYNVPQRQRAFRSHSEEYAKILDVVGRYAVHCQGVAFACKKHGDSAVSIAVPSNATTVDRIRQIHGSGVANELIEIHVHDQRLGFEASGWTSNANYHVKKTAVLLFINHRSVESSAIKSAIQRTYAPFLPKGGHPFIYLSLSIDPQRVDVNVHPTKREVNFLNEDEIIDILTATIRDQLAKVDTSRTFTTQSLLPGVKVPTAPTPSRPPKTPSTSTPKPPENNLVRTDPSLRKITSMLSSTHPSHSSAPDITYTQSARTPIKCRLTTVKDLRAAVRTAMHAGLTDVLAAHTYIGLVDSRRRIVALQSGVKLYLVDYGLLANAYFYQVGLTNFANFGTIAFDPPLSIQSLIEIAVDVEQKSSTTMGSPATTEQPIDWAAIAPAVTAQLIASREMLHEYFSLEISAAGELRSIPLLVKHYMPSLAKLPRFLMRLGPCVDWRAEEACFRSFLVELAGFYTPEQLPNPAVKEGPGWGGDIDVDVVVDGDVDGDRDGDGTDPTAVNESGRRARATAHDGADDGGDRAEIGRRRVQMERMLEHVLFPAIKARLVATKDLLGGVVEVANLKGLYRVFERC